MPTIKVLNMTTYPFRAHEVVVLCARFDTAVLNMDWSGAGRGIEIQHYYKHAIISTRTVNRQY